MRVWKLVRNDAATGIEGIDAERVEKLDFEDPYFQSVSGFSAFNQDWSCQWMCPWSAVLDGRAPRPSVIPESQTRRLRPI